MIPRYLTCGLIFSLAISGCKDDAVVIDTTPPVVEVLAPERNKIFSPKDTVFIRAVLSDETTLWKVGVHIHNPDTVFSYVAQLKTNHFEVDTFWVVNDPNDRTYTIYIDGFDKAENLTQKGRFFQQLH